MFIWRPKSTQGGGHPGERSSNSLQADKPAKQSAVWSVIQASLIIGGLFVGALADTTFGVPFLIAVTLLLLFASWRCVFVTRSLLRGALSAPGDSFAQSLCILAGWIGYLILLLTMLGTWGAIVITFFFMKTGGASGVGLGLAAIAFPVFYGMSELLLAIGLEQNAV